MQGLSATPRLEFGHPLPPPTPTETLLQASSEVRAGREWTRSRNTRPGGRELSAAKLSKKSGRSQRWPGALPLPPAPPIPGPSTPPPGHTGSSWNQPLSGSQRAHHVSRRLGPVRDGTRLVCFLPGGPRFTSCLLQLSACPRPPRIPRRASLTSSRFPQVGGHPPSPSQSPPKPGLRLKATGLLGTRDCLTRQEQEKQDQTALLGFLRLASWSR